MIRQAGLYGAILGLCEAAFRLSKLPHLELADALWAVGTGALAFGAAAALVAAILALSSRRLREGAESAVATGVALGVFVAVLRLRFFAGVAALPLSPTLSGIVLEGLAVGAAGGWLAARAAERSLRWLWRLGGAAALVAATAVIVNETAHEKPPALVAAAPRPHLLLISIDTLRADLLGAFGDGGGLSPNIDRLAAAGLAQLEFSPALRGILWEGIAVGAISGWLATRVAARPLRLLWRVAAAVALVAATSVVVRQARRESSASLASAARRPHLILVSIDTLRADLLGAYGGEGGLSPNIDRLADEGVRFTRAASPVPLTGPSHTTMLTGLYPQRHGAIRNGSVLRRKVSTLADELAGAGYRTGGFVSAWPLSQASSGLAERFQHYDEDFSVGGWFPATAKQISLLWLLDQAASRIAEWRAGADVREQYAGSPLHRDGAVTVARALSWIADGDERPFFAFVHLYEPHGPYAPPAELARRVDPGYQGSLDRFEITRNRKRLQRLFSDPAAVARIRKLYAAEVARADEIVGELLEGLARRGFTDDTIVLLTADHGEGLTEHGEYFDHGEFVYETTARVPLVLRWPHGEHAGERRNELVSLADVAPTLLELAGVPPAAGLDGRSLLPLLDGTLDALHEFAFGYSDFAQGHAQAARQSVRTQRFKLIWNVDDRLSQLGGPTFEELYDLDADPGELDNLALTGAEPDILQLLRQQLRSQLSLDAVEADPVDPETARKLRALGYL